jgi:hypothetical protein
MRCSAVAVLGLTGLIGCASDDNAFEAEVDYISPTGVAIGDEILVAMTRIQAGKPNQIDVARVRGGEADPLSPALVGDDQTSTLGSPQLAAIDGQAYLTFYSQRGYHGAPVSGDDVIDTGAIVDLGFNPTLTRAGDRFAAVSFPQQPFIVVFPPVDRFRATFVRRDGKHDGEIDVATEASPVGTIGAAPPCAGNAKVLALPFRRPSLSGSYLFVARVSDKGALLDPDGIQIAPDGNDRTAGEAQLAVTDDGGVLVVYERSDGAARSIHAARIERGASADVSDQVVDLTTVPSLLVPAGEHILAVSVAHRASDPPPTFASFETRILDDHGRTVSGPFTITSGEPQVAVIATPGGFAALHGGTGRDPQLTFIGRDGQPGETLTLATAHRTK